MKRLAPLAASLLLIAACSDSKPPPAAPFKLDIAMKELMQHVIDPPADVFWGASGTIITAQGERDRAPTDDAGWGAAVSAAAMIAEGGNILLLPGRAVDEKEWMEAAQQLVDAGLAGMKAAQAKDKNAVFETGGQIYVVCMKCHKKYVFGQ